MPYEFTQIQCSKLTVYCYIAGGQHKESFFRLHIHAELSSFSRCFMPVLHCYSHLPDWLVSFDAGGRAF